MPSPAWRRVLRGAALLLLLGAAAAGAAPAGAFVIGPPGLWRPPFRVPNEPLPPPPGAGPIVALDPGHGAAETGAIGPDGLREKDVNLAIARRVAVLLQEAGLWPILTRSGDSAVNAAHLDLTGDGRVTNDDDLQARVDLANAAGAALLVSIHNNARVGDPAYGGTEVWYCSCRPFAADSRRFAELLDADLVAAIRTAGYPVVDRGAADDPSLRKPGGHLYLLGPRNVRIARPSRMPGALGESLYLSNPREEALLAQPAVLDAIARGYRDAIVAYFAAPTATPTMAIPPARP